jgi:7-carboxy-7-deazaguanine synthase
MRKLPIHECFYTWQGEGVHMGRAAYFIRTFGCPVKCPWCDSAGTWHPDFIPEKVEKVDPQTLADQAKASGCEIVVITGGEPAIHDLTELTTALKERGLPAHLETSGGFPLKGDFAWITVSPKWWKMPLKECLDAANELKIIVEDATTITRWMEALGPDLKTPHIWLHPEWSQHESPEVLQSISEWVKQHGGPFRAGWQLHKCYNVDALDPGSRPLVPLGGNPNLGY